MPPGEKPASPMPASEPPWASFFFLRIRRPPKSPPFPSPPLSGSLFDPGAPAEPTRVGRGRNDPRRLGRSEEHTSELQSRPHLVCRLLLAKKNLTRWGLAEPDFLPRSRQPFPAKCGGSRSKEVKSK